ncbi:hypothetical protein JCM3770_003219 [Rhodotorula araucariae]
MPELVAPTPRGPLVRFAVDLAASPAPSPVSTPSATSSTAHLVPPPPASPARAPVPSRVPPSSSSTAALFRYSESDDEPLASTSYARVPAYPPKAGDDSEELDEDWATGNEPLMEGLAYQGLRRASLDLRGEERRLKEMAHDAEEYEPPEWLSRGGGVWAGIANMSNSILGAGIIGLPYALREAGFFSGIILLVILGIVTDWTIRLIVLNAKMSGRRTYIDILDSCFGRAGRAAASFFQFAFAFGGMCAFCVILGDTIPRVLLSLVGPDSSPIVSFFISRPVVTTILTVGISYPLSLYRDIEKLSHASALALVSMVVIVISVGVRGPSVEDALKGDPSQRWTVIDSGFFEAIGVISFAFVCHHNSLLIYGSLRTPTLDRFAHVTHVSTTLSVIACLCMSTSGFLVFTDRTQGNILNNFSEDDLLINIARACFGLNMFTTLPLEAFVCREVAETYFWPDDHVFNKKRHILITTALVLSALIVSLITCDLGFILELAGGFSATALAYLFPAACFLRLSGTGRAQAPQRAAAWVCAGFGILVMVLSTVLSIRKAIKGESHKHRLTPASPTVGRLAAMRNRTSTLHPEGEVGAITVLKSQPRADEALELLRKIHALVKPIMKKHGWYLPVLSEFFPSNANLLGINVNSGAKICIRLRPAHDPASFLPLEDSLIGTMLHELTHNVRGPHDDVFFKQLDALQDEFDAVQRSGYLAFTGSGRRVGEGVAHDRPGGLREAREMALRRLEERERVRKDLGRGGRLGGKPPETRGKRMGDILAEAAERRLGARKMCGGDDAHNHPSGSKQEDLPADVQEDIARAERDSRRVVLDLTCDTSDDDDVVVVAGPSSGGHAATWDEPHSAAGDANRAQSSSPEFEVLPAKRASSASMRAFPPAKRRAIPAVPSSPHASTRPSASVPPSTLKDSSLSVAASTALAAPGGWTCSLCTFHNPSPLALGCQVCLSVRPAAASPRLPPAPARAPVRRLPPGPARVLLAPGQDGWTCAACTTVNQHLFWSCGACGTVKRSSAVG